jgi:3-phenylpropionate/trans-cinnamate dioxygenase ferredoxin subunit
MNTCARPISVDKPDGKNKPCDESKWTQVCDLERLVKQGIVCADAGGVDLILIWYEERAVACERACPHEQADLSHGHLSAGRLVCPHHAASFDLKDGEVSSGWSSRPLRIYPARVEQGGVWVQVNVS